MIYILALGGMVLLLASGDLLVRGAISLAANFGVSPLLVGLTIIAFGTSAPELMIGIGSALTGVPGLMLGDVVGSSIANIFLVLGLPALIRPVACDHGGLVRNLLLMIGVSMIFTALAFSGVFDLHKGIFLLLLLAAFLWYSLRQHRGSTPPVLELLKTDVALGGIAGRTHSNPLAAAFVLGGMIGLPIGAKLLIDGAVAAARLLDVGEDMIGVSLVAFGTSLPELATSLAAAFRRHSDIVLGNVIGSNIFNLLAVMGITAAIAPVPVPERFLTLDLWVMLTAAMSLLPFTLVKREIGRGAGLAFILGYAIYMLLLFQSGIGAA